MTFTLFKMASSIVSSPWTAGDQATEWQLIHHEIVQYRTRNDVSIMTFLERCDLPHTGYYQQLCSVSGNNIQPSNRPGSDGRKFLDAVENCLKKEQLAALPQTLPINESITDSNGDNSDDLCQSGLLWLQVDGGKRNLIVNWLNTADEKSLIDYFSDVSLKNDDLEVEFHPMEFL